MSTNGLIVKAVGGLYSVKTSDNVISCKARGIFRQKNISPCAGDSVIIEIETDGTGIINEILTRKNCLIRPPLANLDMLVFVVSTCEPAPNYLILDKFIAIAEYMKIEPVIAITKADMAEFSQIADIYKKSGIKTVVTDYSDDNTRGLLLDMFKGKITAFTGNSGVGKSTLINYIDAGLELDTAQISRKLGRGKHTTRQVELYALNNGGYVADTPGFSTFETNKYAIIKKNELAGCFRDFADYTSDCRFQDCSHTKERDCGVIEAVKDGKICESRHKSYVTMYTEAENIHEWELKQR